MNTFKYYLKKSDTEFYSVNESGGVVYGVTPVETKTAPLDWKDMQIGFQRNLSKWGIFREFTVPLQFVQDAAKIVRYVNAGENYQGNLQLYVEILDEFSQTYLPFYLGSLDLTNTFDSRDAIKTNVMERGLAELIEARENVVYEIPADGINSVQVKIGGVRLGSSAQWIPGQGNSDSPPVPENELIGLQNTEMLPINFSGQEVAVSSFISTRSVNYSAFVPGATQYVTSEWLFRANTTIVNGRVSGLFQVRVNVDTGSTYGYKIRLHVRRSGATFASYEIYDSGIVLPGGVWNEFDANIDFSLPIDLLNGDFVYITSQFASGVGATEKFTQYYTNRSIFTFTYQAAVADSIVYGKRIFTVLQEVIEKLTEGTYTVQSNFLNDPTDISSAKRFDNWDNSPYNTIFMSGNSLRGLPNPIIKVSLEDIRQFLWAQYVMSFNIESDVLKVEPMKYTLNQNHIVATITQNTAPTWEYFKDKLFNVVKIGYQSYDNRNVEGKNEFNTTLTLLAKDITTISKEDTAISPIRADTYGIESIRSETFDSDQEDNRSDNDTFVLEIDPVPDELGIYKPYRPAGIVSGVDDPAGVLNTTMTPGRMLNRHKPRLRSMLKSGILTFQTMDKNPELISDFGAGLVVENANVDFAPDVWLGHDVTPLHGNRLFKFDAPTPNNLYADAINNPRGIINFDYYGTTIPGFIYDAGIIPADKNPYSFTLIATHDFNPAILIR